MYFWTWKLYFKVHCVCVWVCVKCHIVASDLLQPYGGHETKKFTIKRRDISFLNFLPTPESSFLFHHRYLFGKLVSLKRPVLWSMRKARTFAQTNWNTHRWEKKMPLRRKWCGFCPVTLSIRLIRSLSILLLPNRTENKREIRLYMMLVTLAFTWVQQQRHFSMFLNIVDCSHFWIMTCLQNKEFMCALSIF